MMTCYNISISPNISESPNISTYILSPNTSESLLLISTACLGPSVFCFFCLFSHLQCGSGCVPASWHPDSGREALEVLGLRLLCTTGTSVMKDVVDAFREDALNGSKWTNGHPNQEWSFKHTLQQGCFRTSC